jgi:hypothetical protein
MMGGVAHFKQTHNPALHPIAARWAAPGELFVMQGKIMKRLKSYLREQLKSFDRTALWSPTIIKEGGTIVFWWASPAFALALIAAKCQKHLPSAYLKAAIEEGIGPHLWNLIGTIGLIFVGLAFLFPRARFIARSAYQVLINTYAIGGLTLGLALGQFAAAVTVSRMAVWRTWLIGAGAAFLALQVLLLNFSLWYLGNLMVSGEENDGFLYRVARVHFRIRLCAAVFVIGLSVIVLFMEK